MKQDEAHAPSSWGSGTASGRARTGCGTRARSRGSVYELRFPGTPEVRKGDGAGVRKGPRHGFRDKGKCGRMDRWRCGLEIGMETGMEMRTEMGWRWARTRSQVLV